MEFNWAGAIDRNREQLLDIVTQLFILAGIRTGWVVEMLPFSLKLRILAILRPAEFATRRLIATAACKLVTVAESAPEKPEGQPPHSATPGPDQNTHPETPATSADDREKAATFPLFDPFKPFCHPWREDDDSDEEPKWSPQFYTPPNQPVDARSLCRRIKALEQALQHLEKHAARLARWRARRDNEKVRPRRFSPMRPGYPPGWRKKPKTHIEEVLRECNFLALDAWDTS